MVIVEDIPEYPKENPGKGKYEEWASMLGMNALCFANFAAE